MPTLHAPFVHHALHAPNDHLAVVAYDVDGATVSFTYPTLLRRAAGVAQRLHELLGPDAGSCVPIVMRKGWEQVVAVLGCALAGKAYVPVDPAPPARALGMVRSLESPVVLTQGDHLAGLKEGVPHVTAVDVATLPECSFQDIEAREATIGDDDLAYVIFTSGTTGTPKGIEITHGAVANTLAVINQRFGVGPSDRVLALSQLSFDLSVYDIFGTLGAGGTVILPPAEAYGDPLATLQIVRDAGVTVWNSVPALLSLAVDPTDRSDAGRRYQALWDACSLRLVLLSGDWIPVSLPPRLRALLPPAVSEGLEVISLGGATEASVWSICYPIPPDLDFPTVPYGRALEGQTVEIRNPATHALCEVGETGGIFIGGQGLARGYWRDPALTREKFLEHDGVRLYDTGDLGRYLPDHTIEFLGRRDFQVKISGHRIELQDVEAHLAAHPSVNKAVAVANENRTALLAFVELDASELTPKDEAHLKEHLRKRVPEYMVPARIHHVSTWPLSAQGKLNRSALLDLHGAQEHQRLLQADYVPPTDALEASLIQGVEARLGVHPIGRDTDLVALGIASVDAMALVAQIEQHAGCRLPVDALWQARTCRALAALIRSYAQPQKTSWARRAVVPIQPRGTRRPLFLIHPWGGDVFVFNAIAQSLVDADQPVYGIQVPDDDFNTFDELMNLYLAGIREVQPEPPYLIGGYSAGVLAALSLCHRLLEQGENCKAVFIDGLLLPPNPDDMLFLFRSLGGLQHEFDLETYGRLLGEEMASDAEDGGALALVGWCEYFYLQQGRTDCHIRYKELAAHRTPLERAQFVTRRFQTDGVLDASVTAEDLLQRWRYARKYFRPGVAADVVLPPVPNLHLLQIRAEVVRWPHDNSCNTEKYVSRFGNLEQLCSSDHIETARIKGSDHLTICYPPHSAEVASVIDRYLAREDVANMPPRVF